MDAKVVKLNGILRFYPERDAWHDSFTVVDDDGVALVIDAVKSFDGHEVNVTIARTPDALR